MRYKNKKWKYVLALVMFFSFLSFSHPALAGIVPCGSDTTPCTLCHLITGFKALVDWGLGVLIVAALTAITIAGIMYIVSSGSAMMETSKKFLTASLTGFAIVVGAWLIVDVTIVWILQFNPGSGIGIANWHTLTCSEASSALSGGSGSPAGAGGQGAQNAAKTADQIAQDQNNCNSGCDQTGGDTAACKQGCADKATAATQQAQQAAQQAQQNGGGNGASAAQQAAANGCQYSQPLRNNCTGNPGYTDCGQLACNNAASNGQNLGDCSSINTSKLAAEAQPLTDTSTLKAGDTVIRPPSSPGAKDGHAAICENDGCTTITHAAGIDKGIVTGANNYLISPKNNTGNLKVIPAHS